VEFALENLSVRKAMVATFTMFAVALVAVTMAPPRALPAPHVPSRQAAVDPAMLALAAAFPGLVPFHDDFQAFGGVTGFITAASVRSEASPAALPDPLHERPSVPRPAFAADYGYGAGPVRDLVVGIFTRIAGPSQVPTAMCVAHRESRFSPLVTNWSSGAAGIFQWLPHSWWVYSHRYGLDGASPYDPVANITVAAHVVADDGWGPWAGPGC
jgi:soluble lytic murein transglycosylase-like protein